MNNVGKINKRDNCLVFTNFSIERFAFFYKKIQAFEKIKNPIEFNNNEQIILTEAIGSIPLLKEDKKIFVKEFFIK